MRHGHGELFSERKFHFKPFFCLRRSLLVFTVIPGVLTTSMLSKSSLTAMKILRVRNKHNVRYDTRIKCKYFYNLIINLTCIQCIHDLLFSANQCNINNSPTVLSVVKTMSISSRGQIRWMVKSLKVEGKYRHGKHLENQSVLNGLTFFIMQNN